MTKFYGQIANEISDAIGPEATLRLLQERGGTEIMIPKRSGDSYLADVIGEKNLNILRETLGAGKFQLPMEGGRGQGARRLRAIEMLKAGSSWREVALSCDLHTKTVQRYAAQIRDDRQIQMKF